MRTDQPPKPNPKNIKEMLDPLDDYAESFIIKTFNRIFSLTAFRVYFMAFLGSYVLINSEINLSLSDAKLSIELTTEFVVIVTMLSIIITLFSVVKYFTDKQKTLEIERRNRAARLWKNFVVNIQPYLEGDPEKMSQLSLINAGFLDSSEIQDYIIRIVGPELKQLTEENRLAREEIDKLLSYVDFLDLLKMRFSKKKN